MHQQYTEELAVTRLRKNSVRVGPETKKEKNIQLKEKEILLPTTGPGISLWGAVDYLVGKHDYRYGRA